MFACKATLIDEGHEGLFGSGCYNKAQAIMNGGGQ